MTRYGAFLVTLLLCAQSASADEPEAGLRFAEALFAERDYVASGSVLAVGETPKTEYFWYESRLDEPDGGPCVAQMVMMLRFMKGSSPLWSGA